MNRQALTHLLTGLTVTFALTAWISTATARAEPSGDEPIGGVSVTIYDDLGGDGIFGNGNDVAIGSDLTDGGGRWDVDISGAPPEARLGAVAVIALDRLSEPTVCESNPLVRLSSLGHSVPLPENYCWALGADLFADETNYLNGIPVWAIRDDNQDGLYTRYLPDIVLGAGLTHPIAPGSGDVRFYDIDNAAQSGLPIGLVFDLGPAASQFATLSGRLWEPIARED